MLKKIFSTIGVGGAKVDTVLDNHELRAGGEVKGKVIIYGGKADQHINKLIIYTMTSMKGKTYTMWETLVCENMQIHEGEKYELDFTYMLPPDMPVTERNVVSWLYTGLDVSMAKDSSDEDHIKVLPHPIVQNIFDIMHQMNFRVDKASIAEVHPEMDTFLPVIQEYEFKPQGGDFHKKIDEVEIIFVPREGDVVDLYLEIDKKAGMLREMFDKDEKHVHIRIDASVGYDGDQLGQLIQNILHENS